MHFSLKIQEQANHVINHHHFTNRTKHVVMGARRASAPLAPPAGAHDNMFCTICKMVMIDHVICLFILRRSAAADDRCSLVPGEIIIVFDIRQ